MAQHGVTKFALLDKDAQGAERTIQLIEASVPHRQECLFIQVDAGDHKAMTQAVRDAVGHFKRIDYAISGIGIPGPMGSSLVLEAEELQNILNINLVSQFAVQKELLAHMQGQTILASTGYVDSTRRVSRSPQQV